MRLSEKIKRETPLLFLISGNHFVFYLVDGQAVNIVRILDGSTNFLKVLFSEDDAESEIQLQAKTAKIDKFSHFFGSVGDGSGRAIGRGIGNQLTERGEACAESEQAEEAAEAALFSGVPIASPLTRQHVRMHAEEALDRVFLTFALPFFAAGDYNRISQFRKERFP